MRASTKIILYLLETEAIVLSTYKDAKGVLTIGAGHTAAAGGLVPEMGMTITLSEAIDIFIKDLTKFEARVRAAVKRELKQNEFDGLLSFDFNTGAVESGTVDDKIDAGNFDAAMDSLEMYKKSGGKVLPGLIIRRAIERKIFDKGEYPHVMSIPVYNSYNSRPKNIRVDEILGLPAFVNRAVLEKVEVPVHVEIPVPTTPTKVSVSPVVVGISGIIGIIGTLIYNWIVGG